MENEKDASLDIVDNVAYSGEVSETSVEDEGDEDNLGGPIGEDGAQDVDDTTTVDDDVVTLDNEILDDSEYNDSSFDCD